MNLSIRDRIAMDAVLPKQGNYVTMIAVKEIKSKTVITTKEIEQFQMVFGERMVNWSDEGNKYEIDVEFGETLLVIIRGSLQAKNSANELTADMVPLYEKFEVMLPNITG